MKRMTDSRFETLARESVSANFWQMYHEARRARESEARLLGILKEICETDVLRNEDEELESEALRVIAAAEVE